jgi:N-acetylmuramoyl-L-alanine amidase
MEKDLCLDVALRLGRMIQEKLPGTEIIYTREDDTFVPLEQRTAIANQAKADLFISVHANSSRDQRARGIETFYLSFAATEDALEVAARENALSQSSIHELQDLLKKIARNEKIDESRELAREIQENLSKRMQRVSRYNKNRGVKKAPFVVLIGANMPSVLTEISFLSNPSDEAMLKKGEHRQRVAEGIYKGVETYLQNLNSLSFNRPSQPETSR